MAEHKDKHHNAEHKAEHTAEHHKAEHHKPAYHSPKSDSDADVSNPVREIIAAEKAYDHKISMAKEQAIVLLKEARDKVANSKLHLSGRLAKEHALQLAEGRKKIATDSVKLIEKAKEDVEHISKKKISKSSSVDLAHEFLSWIVRDKSK